MNESTKTGQILDLLREKGPMKAMDFAEAGLDETTALGIRRLSSLLTVLAHNGRVSRQRIRVKNKDWWLYDLPWNKESAPKYPGRPTGKHSRGGFFGPASGY